MVQSLSENKNISIVTDQINNPTYLDDLAGAISRIVQLEKTGTYNIGGSELLSRYEFTQKIAEFFNLDFSLVKQIVTKDLNQPAPRPLKSGLINLKAETELGYKPRLLNECFQLMQKSWR